MLGMPDITAGVGEFNLLDDPFAQANGGSDAFRRACAGEVVQLPDLKLDFATTSPIWRTKADRMAIDYMMFPLHNAQGQVEAVVSCMLDITARKAAEDEVRRLNHELENLVALRTAQLSAAVDRLEAEVAHRRLAERRYSTLVDHFPNGFVCLFGHDLRYTIAGGAALPAIGLSRERMEGKTLWDLGLPPDLVREAEQLYRAALAGETLEFEETISGRAFSGRAVPITDEHGAVVAGMTVSWDITERRAAEAAQRESEALFRDVWESAVDAMALVDSEGIYVLTNPAHQRLYGYPPGTAVGRPFTMIAPEGQREGIMDYYRASFHTSEPLMRGEYVVERADGSFLEVEAQLSFIMRDGRRIAELIIARDITARRQADEQRIALERKLLETQKLESLGVLAGGIAHDFNNLLTSTLGHAELALLDVPPNSEVSDHIHGVISGVRHTADLTRQLLAYAGKGRFVMQPLQLNTLIREMSDLLRVSVAKHCTLRYELAPTLPAINADSAQMRQIVLNLLVNASEAIPAEGGAITLSTSLAQLGRQALDALSPGAELAEAPYVCLSVADTGVGMDAATSVRIFDPFFSTKLTGRGLGLAAVQGIVRSHKGALRVSSRPGAGTTFELWFPAIAGTVEACTPSAPVAAAAQARTVLVIDDEAPVREIARRLLERLGYQVRLAPGGQAGLALLAEGIPDLVAVLVDLLMPEMGGDEVARGVHALLPTTPVILMSGYSAETIVEELTAPQLAGVMQKPFTLDTLRATLQAATQQSL
jgi:PAS domain S-box-containing protein